MGGFMVKNTKNGQTNQVSYSLLANNCKLKESLF